MDLTKEQKKYFGLGAVLVAIILSVVFFGVKLSASTLGEARDELQILTHKIESADRTLRKSRENGVELVESISELTEYITKTPPDKNYYSWASELVYALARGVNLSVDTVTETGVAPAQKKKGVVRLESYSLRITARGKYSAAKAFLREIDEQFPLVRTTGIEMSTGSAPDVHRIQLFIEWPFNLGFLTEAWKDEAVRLPVLQAARVAEQGHKPPLIVPPVEPAKASDHGNSVSHPVASPKPEPTVVTVQETIAMKLPTPPKPRIPIAPQEASPPPTWQPSRSVEHTPPEPPVVQVEWPQERISMQSDVKVKPPLIVPPVEPVKASDPGNSVSYPVASPKAEPAVVAIQETIATKLPTPPKPRIPIAPQEASPPPTWQPSRSVEHTPPEQPVVQVEWPQERIPMQPDVKVKEERGSVSALPSQEVAKTLPPETIPSIHETEKVLPSLMVPENNPVEPTVSQVEKKAKKLNKSANRLESLLMKTSE